MESKWSRLQVLIFCWFGFNCFTLMLQWLAICSTASSVLSGTGRSDGCGRPRSTFCLLFFARCRLWLSNETVEENRVQLLWEKRSSSHFGGSRGVTQRLAGVTRQHPFHVATLHSVSRYTGSRWKSVRSPAQTTSSYYCAQTWLKTLVWLDSGEEDAWNLIGRTQLRAANIALCDSADRQICPQACCWSSGS